MNIKFYWDFFGPHAEGTANHHCRHLEQFAKLKSIPAKTGIEKTDDYFFSAWMIVDASAEADIRILKPKRHEKMI